MPNNYWVKLYIEILDDPKMGRLPDRLFRRAIEIFLLAGDAHLEGVLPSVDDMAWRLRLNPGTIEEDLQALEKTGIVSKVDGTWFVTKFSKRQARISDAERMQGSRDRKRREQYYGDEGVTLEKSAQKQSGYEPVTTRNADIDTDIDTYSNNINGCEGEKQPENAVDGQPGNSSDLGSVYKAYEENIGALTPMIADELEDLIQEHGATWVIEAIKIAAINGKRSLAYVRGILQRWKVDGYGTNIVKHTSTGKNGSSPVETAAQRMLREEKERDNK